MMKPSTHATLQRKGIAALAADIMAARDTMTRIAGGDDGDRRIVDFSHVVELLNEASRGRGGHAREFLEHLSALESQEERITQLESQLASQAAQIESLSARAERAESESAMRSSEIEDLSQQLSAAAQEQSKQQSQGVRLEAQLREKSAQLSHVQDRLRGVEARLRYFLPSFEHHDLEVY